MKRRLINFEPRPFFVARFWLAQACERITTSLVLVGLKRFRLFLRRLVVCLVCAGALPILAVAFIAIVLIVYPLLADDTLISELVALSECTQSIEVRDPNGWIGAIPRSFPEDNPCPGAVKSGWRSHSATSVLRPPTGWWSMYLAEENPRLPSWWKLSIQGLDLLSLCKVILLDGLIRGKTDRGASSIPMQIVRSLRGLSAGPKQPRRAKLRRKLIELRDAPLLYKRLGGAQSIELRRWAAQHLPLIRGSRGSKLGGSIYGIADASQILFSKTYAELTLAEQAILVASAKKPLVIAPEDDKSGQCQAQQNWEKVVDRSLRMLDRRPDHPAFRAAKTKIMDMNIPTPTVPEGARHLLPNDSAKRLAYRALPQKRAEFLAKGELIQSFGELLDVYGEIPKNLASIQLTLDAVSNRRFKQQVEDILDLEEQRVPRSLEFPPASKKKAHTADVTLSLVRDSTGQVVRHYSSGNNDRIWSGPNAKRRQRRYRPEFEDRAVGSLAKIALAPLMATRFDSHHLLCQKYLAGLKNHDGTRGFRECSSLGALISVSRAYADSNNLAIAWGIDHFSEEQISAAVAAAGLNMPKQVKPYVAVAFGHLPGSVRSQLRMVAALSSGARNERAQAVLPTMIQSIGLLENGNIKNVSFDKVRDRDHIDLSPWFSSPHVADFVAEILEAPTKADGTLRGMHDTLTNLGLQRIASKSGTTTNNAGLLRDQYVLGSYLDSGDQYSFHLLIGSPNPNQPLIRGIPRTLKIRLIEIMIRSYQSQQRERKQSR